VVLPLRTLELWAPYKARREWAGPVAKYLQFAKAGSAATLPQQEKKNFADVQRGGFI
jgi:hypothetical protein